MVPVTVRRVAVATVLVVCVSALVASAGIRWGVPADHRASGVVPGWTVDAVPTVLVLVPAVVVAWRSAHRLGGWMLAVAGLWALDCLAAGWLVFATAPGAEVPGEPLAAWFSARVGAGLLVFVPLVLAVWPDGGVPRDRWRWPLVFALLPWAGFPLVLLSASGEFLAERFAAGGPGVGGYRDADLLGFLGVPVPWSRTAFAVLLVLALPSLVVVLARLVVLTRDEDPLRRTRARWMVWAALAYGLAFLPSTVIEDSDAVEGWVSTAGTGLVAAVAAVGLLRPDLVDVDRLLAGTVVYAVVLGSVVVVDVALVAAVLRFSGDALSTRDGLLFATLLVTAVYGPLRERLWRLVRRVVLGEREDRYRVLTSLAAALESSPEAGGQVSAVTAALVRAFRLRWAELEVRSGTVAVAATTGHRPTHVRAVPLAYRGTDLGTLRLPATGSGGRMTRRDERLLTDVLRQAAAAIRAEALAARVQLSRSEIVTAAEEDRRRIRRDLHDGLGPALAAAGLGVDRARNLLAKDPAAAGVLVREVRQDLLAAVGDVRRLVEGLRPPALDDLGLVSAVAHLAERFSGPGRRVRLVADGFPDGVAVPAAVEVAAYRIVSEALTNVVRHSGASEAVVALAVEDAELRVEVRDDGTGLPALVNPGVGLASMRQRAEELRGRFWTGSDPELAGMLIRVWLPVDSRPAPALDLTAIGEPAVQETVS